MRLNVQTEVLEMHCLLQKIQLAHSNFRERQVKNTYLNMAEWGGGGGGGGGGNEDSYSLEIQNS